jgi:hypothetical protein
LLDVALMPKLGKILYGKYNKYTHEQRDPVYATKLGNIAVSSLSEAARAYKTTRMAKPIAGALESR